MSNKKTKKKETTIEVSNDEFLTLLGLRAMYEESYAKCEQIMTAFAEIVNLNDEEYSYDKGAYLLQDNAGENISFFKSKLRDSNIIVKES